MLWGFQGSATEAAGFVEEYRLEHTTLADEDRSLYANYYITEDGGDAFALYPRHYVIDADGRFAYVSTQVQPEALLAAIEGAAR